MKNLVHLGKVLSKSEKKSITGGRPVCCHDYPQCPDYNTLSCIIIRDECHYYSGGLAC